MVMTSEPRPVSLLPIALRREPAHAGIGAIATGTALETGATDLFTWHAFLESAPRVGLGRLLYAALAKRALDLAVAVLTLALLCPLLLVVALAIRFDSRGPAVFRQQRVGRGGRPFTVYKFRTMRVARPGDEVKLFRDENGTVSHKVRNDPRVTRVGRLLRKTSVDELPQLLNVLKGDMSLIGPRPELVSIVEGYQPWQHRRHLVRPGITGWWQVSGRSDKPMHENTELDLYYVDRLSFGMDVKIVARTLSVVVRGSGAF